MNSQRELRREKDPKSVEKMKIVDQLLHGDNVGVDFVQNRVRFLSGLTADEIQSIGDRMFHKKYQNKMYPEMKALIQNLENFGFEVWILSASPEFALSEVLRTAVRTSGRPYNRRQVESGRRQCGD